LIGESALGAGNWNLELGLPSSQFSALSSQLPASISNLHFFARGGHKIASPRLAEYFLIACVFMCACSCTCMRLSLLAYMHCVSETEIYISLSLGHIWQTLSETGQDVASWLHGLVSGAAAEGAQERVLEALHLCLRVSL